MDTQFAATAPHDAAVVWLDRRHAYVARQHEGHPEVTEVPRDADTDEDYLLRVIHEAGNTDRVVVMGSDATRIDFEREYVALYRRPDRLIDVGAAFDAERARLIETLRFVEPPTAFPRT